MRGGSRTFRSLENDKTSATSASTARARDPAIVRSKRRCGVGWQCYFYNSPQPPVHPPRHVDVVLFLLAAFRERIKEKERAGGNERESKRWSRETGVAGGNGVLFHPSQRPSILCSTVLQRLTKPRLG